MENETIKEITDSIIESTFVAENILLENKSMIGNTNPDPSPEENSETSEDDDEEWQKYEEKWKKYLTDSTFYEPPKATAKPNEIEPGEVVENNAELIMEKRKINQCHICELSFDNLEDHFIASHSIIETKKEEMAGV